MDPWNETVSRLLYSASAQFTNCDTLSISSSWRAFGKASASCRRTSSQGASFGRPDLSYLKSRALGFHPHEFVAFGPDADGYRHPV